MPNAPKISINCGGRGVEKFSNMALTVFSCFFTGLLEAEQSLFLLPLLKKSRNLNYCKNKILQQRKELCQILTVLGEETLLLSNYVMLHLLYNLKFKMSVQYLS